MSDLCGICYLTHKKWQTKGGLQKLPSGCGELRLSIMQSNLTVHYDMPAFPAGIMKVSSALAQREPKYIFHHHSPFIIHANHLKSEFLKFTDVYKHESSGSGWQLTIPGSTL